MLQQRGGRRAVGSERSRAEQGGELRHAWLQFASREAINQRAPAAHLLLHLHTSTSCSASNATAKADV